MVAMRLAIFILAAAVTLPAAAQLSSPTPASRPAWVKTPSSSLALVIAGKTTTLTLAQLAAMPHKSLTVHNLQTKTEETYSGVPLADLLIANGAQFDKDSNHQVLSSYIVAAGTDGYKVIFSTDEVFSEFHPGDILIADTRDGKPIASDGALKLISSEDTHPVRRVQNLTSITLVAAN